MPLASATEGNFHIPLHKNNKRLSFCYCTEAIPTEACS